MRSRGTGCQKPPIVLSVDRRRGAAVGTGEEGSECRRLLFNLIVAAVDRRDQRLIANSRWPCRDLAADPPLVRKLPVAPSGGPVGGDDLHGRQCCNHRGYGVVDAAGDGWHL